MGVTPTRAAAGTDRNAVAPGATHALRWARVAAWATLVANILLVVTGGAVRLTGSGLGCPTWPRCTSETFTPHGAYDIHAAIEFGNRLLTFVLVAVAVLTLVAAWRTRRRDLTRLALVLALGIPAQAVIGGITVLTDLNPWIVSLHLVCSLLIISVAVLFLHCVGDVPAVPLPRPVARLARAMYATAWLVLYLGTVVTGSGPHAGDAEAPRNGLDPLQLSQLHADAVFLFVGLTVGLLFAVLAAGAPAALRTAVVVLLALEVSQGVIGYVQYFSDLPVLLVGLHMLGAALLIASATDVVLRVTPTDAGRTATAG